MENSVYAVKDTVSKVKFSNLDDRGKRDPQISDDVPVKTGISTKKVIIIVSSVGIVGVIAAIGLGVGIANLNKDDKPPSPHDQRTTTEKTHTGDVINGHWAYWDKWTPCTVTCGGGTQVRKRSCTAPPPQNGGQTCAGESEQTRVCSDWNCPDCSRTCPSGGRLSQKCDICLCPSANLFGVVRNFKNLPIDGVHVYVEDRPYEPIATTNYWGKYSVSSICVSSSRILFKAEGYSDNITAPVALNATTFKANVVLKQFIKPRFTKHPQSKHRFVRQSVTLCCQADGYPVPTEYKWLKDGNEVSNVGTTGFLTFASLSLSDDGIYTCVAETAAGTTKSESAHISVHATAPDTCQRKPTQSVEELPNGCTILGANGPESTIDVGACAPLPCITSREHDNGTCEEWWNSKCCDVDVMEHVEVKCSDFTYSMNKIKSCKCRDGLRFTHLSGRAFGVKNNSQIPFRRGEIYVDGVRKTYTSSSGFFTIDLPTTITRVTITLKNDIDNAFLDAIKVIKVSPGTSLTVNVIVALRPVPSTFNTRLGFSLPLSNVQGEPPAATISIPEHAFTDKNGNIFNGTANAFLNFMDPRKMDDLQSADGEFTFEDENGNTQSLETYGMFRMRVEDSSGSELFLTAPITTQMDASLFNITDDADGNPDIALWHLDPNTGKWVQQGKFQYVATGSSKRKRRSGPVLIEGKFNPASIQPINFQTTVTKSNIYYVPVYTNCDRSVLKGYEKRTRYTRAVVTRSDACYVKVRVFADFSQSKPIKSATVTAATKEIGSSRYKGIERISTNSVTGIACVRIFCNSDVYIYVEGRGTVSIYASDKHSYPSDFLYNNVIRNIQNGTQVHVTSFNPYNGTQSRSDKMYSPIYSYTQERKCTDQDFSNAYIQFAPIARDATLTPALGSLNIFDQKTSWYTKPENDPNRWICFMKVNIKSNIHFFTIIAKSMLLTSTSNPPEQYGVYKASPYWDESTDRRRSKAACLEFRCPQSGVYVSPSTLKRNVKTVVGVRVTSSESIKCTIDSSAINVNSTMNGFLFEADPANNYGEKFGVYVRSQPKNAVLEMCESGSTSSGSPSSNLHTMKPDKHPAVQMTCDVIP